MAEGLPAIGMRLDALAESLQSGYQLTTKGKFSEALQRLQEILMNVPLLVLESKAALTEAQQVRGGVFLFSSVLPSFLMSSSSLHLKPHVAALPHCSQLVEICREYILGLSMEMKRRDLAKDASQATRAAELAAYFTHCDLQPVHLMLTLNTAQTAFFKLKNYKTCSSFARRLLDLGPRPEMASKVCVCVREEEKLRRGCHCKSIAFKVLHPLLTSSLPIPRQAKKILQACDKNPTDAEEVDYDVHNPFSVCAGSYSPIYRGSPMVSSQFCLWKFFYRSGRGAL